MSTPCNCESGKSLTECCQPLISGTKAATTPEELMRSRYTAFCLQEMDYLENTTDPENMESFDRPANEAWAKTASFLGLKVLDASQDGDEGEVEFAAHFEIDGEKLEHHETSRFVRKDGTWFFHSGEVDEENGYFFEEEDSNEEE